MSCLFFCFGAGARAAGTEAELVVSAASSLTDAFREIGAAFEASHPGVKVVFNFGGSGALLQQAAQGAPVDVLAFADEETMERAREEGLVLTGTQRTFARNRLVLALPTSNAPRVARLEDLTHPSVKRVAVGNPDFVPAGWRARDVLTRARLWDALGPKLLFGANVRQVLEYVRRGEVEAGFVYATDVAGAKGLVTAVELATPAAAASYPAAVVASSKKRESAKSFVAFLAGRPAQAALARYGFGLP